MTLAEALRYQQELDAAQRPAYGNPNLAAQGRNANIAERSRAFPFMQAADAQFAKEKSSLSDRGAVTDLINKGFIAGLGGAPVDLINMGLTPLGMGSAFPFGGSEHIKRAMEDYGVATPTERPIMEGIASLTPPRAVMGAARVAGQGAGAVGRAATEIANAEMAGRAGLSGQGGAITYHGSPHRFPPTAKNPLGEFDPMKIGTGEGAQAYGAGAYLAENPQTARIYSADRAYVGSAMQGKPSTINFDDPAWLAQKTIDEFGDTSKATSHLKMVQRTAAKQQSPETKAQVQAAIDLLESGNIATKGNLYKVDLPDEQLAKMLDWDKPLSQQPEIVNTFRQRTSVDIPLGKGRAVQPVPRFWYHNPRGRGFDAEGGIASYNLGREGTELSSMFKEPPKGFVYLSPTPIGSDAVMVDITKLDTSKMRFTGQSEGFAVYGDSIPRTAYATSGKDLYGLISHDLGGDPRAASKTLKELGIPGIRYLDGGSRAAPSSARFVKADVVGAADDLTALAKSFGLDVEVRHSGSNAGKSSYITVFDPMTNRYIKSSFRISDHGTGPLRYQDHINISSPADLAAQKNDLFEWVKRNRTEKGVDTTGLSAPSQGTSNFVVFDPKHMNIIGRE